MEFQDLQHREWRKFYIPEAVCAFGGDYCIHVKKGDPRRLIFHLCGGGVSWCRESAMWPSCPEVAEIYHHVSLYTIVADPQPEVMSIQTGEQSGIHSTTDENPFADWSEVMVPYVTADFHAGAGDLTFTGADGQEHILHHQGYTNLQKILQRVREWFPSPEQLLICGESAGAFGVAAVSGDIMDAFPSCPDVTILCDSAMVPYDDWGATARELWQSPPHIADAVHSDNITLDWFKAIHKRYGDRPRYLFTCGCRDHVLMLFWHYAVDGQFIMEESFGEAFRENLRKMCLELKALTPRFSLYIHDFMKEELSPGVQHCIFGSESYTRRQVDGITPLRWLVDAMNGKAYDVGLELLDK